MMSSESAPIAVSAEDAGAADCAGAGALSGDTPAAAGPKAAGSARLGHVDSLRLIAAGLVLVQHLADRAGGPVARALTAPGPGVGGVVLFFMISGYVIPFSVRGGLDWRSFAVRRVLRIYPLYLASLALVLFLGATGLVHWWADLPHAPAGRWLANLLLVQDLVGAQPVLGVSWTLAIELVWYGLFAMALLGLGQRAGNVLAVAVPASLLVLAALSLVVGARIPLGRPGLIHAAVLGFQVYRFRTGALSRRALWWNVASFVLITWLASIVSFGVFSHARLTLAQVIGPWTLAVVVFLGVVLTPALRHARALDRGPLPALGAASYSIYLLHPVAINLAGQYAPPTLLVPVSLALTGLLALGGYRLVERPGIAFARWLTRRPAVAVPPAASARVAA